MDKNKKLIFVSSGVLVFIVIIFVVFVNQNSILITQNNTSTGTQDRWFGSWWPWGMWFWWSQTVENGTSANTISESWTYWETYISSWDDENALRVTSWIVVLDWVTIEKLSWKTSNTENWDFYGSNAWLLVSSWAHVTISNSNVTTDAQNWNWIFSYWGWTVVTINNTKITTKKDNSWGIQTTWGWITYASNLIVETSGNSSAAIRSDRGGWTVVVDWWTYTSNGSGSPAIYSTADIKVSNAILSANWSEAVVVEWKNSVSLTDVNLTWNMQWTYKDDSENIHNVMIYQSMSWDASVGTASFSVKWWSITALQWDMFYITNTSCNISLEDVNMTLANQNLFTISWNSSSREWWTQGANGWKVLLKTVKQTMNWYILVDEISGLNMSMTDWSNFVWAINKDNDGWDVSLTIDDSSSWTLTADSYVTELNVSNAKNINTAWFTLYVNWKAWN